MKFLALEQFWDRFGQLYTEAGVPLHRSKSGITAQPRHRTDQSHARELKATLRKLTVVLAVKVYDIPIRNWICPYIFYLDSIWKSPLQRLRVNLNLSTRQQRSGKKKSFATSSLFFQGVYANGLEPFCFMAWLNSSCFPLERPLAAFG